MTGRHARRPTIVFAGLALLVVVGIAAATWVATRPRDDATAGGDPPAAAAEGRSSVSTGPPGGAPGTASPSLPEPSPEPERWPLTIHGTGDVSLDPSYIPAFRANGYGWAWSGLDGLFERDDLTIINHECPSTDIVAPLPKTFSFRCDPDALPIARRHGVDVASLANNHGYDHGAEALLDSIRNIEDAGLIAIGAGRDAEEADAPAYVEIKGWRIGLIGVGQVLDPIHQVATRDAPGTAVGHDFGRALAAIREAETNADLVVVTIHWGVELDTRPRDYQVSEARRMVDAGADAIFGHHAHRLQPMDTYRGRPIFYGLGNFVWPTFSVEGSTTAVAQVRVSSDGDVRGRLLPAYIESPGHPVLR